MKLSEFFTISLTFLFYRTSNANLGTFTEFSFIVKAHDKLCMFEDITYRTVFTIISFVEDPTYNSVVFDITDPEKFVLNKQ
jgi:hypothetical protein